MARKCSISDGWEELSDSFSVISDFSSDDEGISAPSIHSEVAIEPVSELPKPILNLPVHSAPGSEPIPAPTSTSPARSEPTIQLPSVAPDEHPFDPQQSQPTNPFNATEYQYESDDDAANESLYADSDVNPPYLLKVLTSLDDIIKDTTVLAKDLLYLGDKTQQVITVCTQLSEQVKELHPIMSTYARLWSVSPRDIPLDPSIEIWMSELRVKSLSLEAALQTLNRQDPRRRRSDVLGSLYLELSKYQKQMDEFLPILQVDYHEFQTKHMSFPVNRGSPPPEGAQPTNHSIDTNATTRNHIYTSRGRRAGARPIPIRNAAAREAPGPVDTDGSVLRTDLYNLKDAVGRGIDIIQNYVSCTTEPMAHLAAVGVKQEYDELFNILSAVLSNQDSDWIEYALNGGITFAEFRQLDILTVRGTTSRIHYNCRALQQHRSLSQQDLDHHVGGLRAVAEMLRGKLCRERS